MERPLTPKQSMFVKEYLIDLNATQAAIRAGYSAKTSEEQGYQLLRKTSVSAAIQKEMDKRTEKLTVNAQDVLEGIIRIASKAESVEDFSNALKGHELLGKHLKLFTDKTELTGAGGAALIPAPVYKVVK